MNDDPHEIRGQKMIQLANEFLPLKRWSFHQSAYLPKEHSQVFYDSEWCRLNFVWSGWDVYVGDMISIYYGRLHAPNDKDVTTWNGEECYCWHRINEPLLFLDGLSPIEAVEHSKYGQLPDVMAVFDKSELGRSLTHKQPEWLVRMHAAIWEHYGQRLFELFDLRRPDLWKQYTGFIGLYYEIEGSIKDMMPPQDKVC